MQEGATGGVRGRVGEENRAKIKQEGGYKEAGSEK